MSGDEAPRTSCHPKASPGECATPKSPREMCHPKNPRGNVPPQSPPRESATPKPPKLQRGHSVAPLLSLQVGAGEKVPLNPHLVTRCCCATKPFRSPAAPSNSCTTTGQEKPTKPWEVLRGLRIRPWHGKTHGMEEKHGRELQSLLCQPRSCPKFSPVQGQD